MAHPFTVDDGTLAAAAGETLTGARVITEAELLEASVFAFDPGGAGRNVDLPTATAALKGQFVFIANTADAAEVLTIRNGGAGTVATPTQNEAAICVCTGLAWRGLVGASN